LIPRFPGERGMGFREITAHSASFTHHPANEFVPVLETYLV
jgi:hypothetical protein